MSPPIYLTMFHVLSFALASVGILIFLRHAGLVAFGIHKNHPRLDPADLSSSVMMAGVFGLCAVAGAETTFSIFSDQAPDNPRLIATVMIITSAVIAAVAIHLYARPFFHTDTRAIELGLVQLPVITVAASLLITSLIVWAGLHAKGQYAVTPDMQLIAAASTGFIMLWLLMTFVLAFGLSRSAWRLQHIHVDEPALGLMSRQPVRQSHRRHEPRI